MGVWGDLRGGDCGERGVGGWGAHVMVILWGGGASEWVVVSG